MNKTIAIKLNNSIKLKNNKKTNQQFNSDIIRKIKKAEEEIKRGEGIEASIAFKEWKVKYGI